MMPEQPEQPLPVLITNRKTYAFHALEHMNLQMYLHFKWMNNQLKKKANLFIQNVLLQMSTCIKL